MATEAFLMTFSFNASEGMYKIGAAAAVVTTGVSSLTYTVPASKTLIFEAAAANVDPRFSDTRIIALGESSTPTTKKVVAPEGTSIRMGGNTNESVLISGFLYDA